LPELIANRYRIDRPLGADAAAFQAFDLQLSRTVVVKILPAQRVKEARFATQFCHQASAAARLAHPNLVAIYDVCESRGNAATGRPKGSSPFMVLEWVPGKDLQAYVFRREPLPSDELEDPFERKLGFLVRVCRGLNYGHEKGLTHGSINPGNIRVTPVGEAKILNFGITPFRKTAFPDYLSPEQLEGQAKLDGRSDLFSFGVVLYELLFGVHPFRAETGEATKARILAAEYRPIDDLLPGCSAQLTEIVNRLLAPNPEDRYPDCKVLESELKKLRTRMTAKAEANAGHLGATFARRTDIARDPGDALARSFHAQLRRREEVKSLLQEARQAEAAHDFAMGCILALQAVELDPGASDAKAEFERMQALLRHRNEPAPMESTTTEVRPACLNGAEPVLTQNRTKPLNRRLLVRVAPIFGLLLLLGLVWVAVTRYGTGPVPVNARNAPSQAEPQAISPEISQGTVSLDVVPWAKVDSIIDLKDGKAVEHEELESPCTFQLPAGRYAITLSHPHFGSRLVRFEVREGITNRVRLYLLSGPQLEKEVGGGLRKSL